MSTAEEFFFPDVAAVAAGLARRMAERLAEGLNRHGAAAAVLPGGRSVGLVAPLLAAQPLDWTRLALTLTDERWVPPSHPDSNEGLVRGLFAGTPAAAAAFTGLYAAAPDPQTALPVLARRLAVLPRPFDVVFLGVGEDGHVASLFPHDAALAADGDCAAVPARAGHPRLTLTFARLRAAREVVILLAGPAKAAVWERARAGATPAEVPLAGILGADGPKVTVFRSP